VTTWSDSALSLVETLAAQIALIVLGFGIERLRPARHQGISCIRLNIEYTVVARVMYAVLYPLSVGLTTLTVNRLGGGLLELPASGVGLAIAVPCYALLMDGGEYLFHRAQHRIPFLWAMHSLHHSDPAVNISTAPRHFWWEMLLKAATIYALIGLLVKANTVVVGFYTFLGLYNYVLHMNLRVGFGRWQPLLNSPQFHRLHHSALPEHHNCNFNQFFPIFDVLCGTYRQPGKCEYPPTGLADAQAPQTLRSMLLWPWRRSRLLSTRIQNAQ
jgi:sterol desaturase/sphingolipid hydroxylase (fatty acid hydroxylase superfamily)